MKRRLVLMAVVILVSLGLAVQVSADAPIGPVTIKTEISFASVPFGGTFEVEEGAGVLGCESGTFVDYPGGVLPPSKGNIAKNFTCLDGGSGTFTANFQPTIKPGLGDQNGHWNITDATGDFVGLRGEGDFFVVFTGPESGVETLTGEVHYNP